MLSPSLPRFRDSSEIQADIVLVVAAAGQGQGGSIMGFVIAGGIGSLGPSEIQVLIPVAAGAGKGEGGHIRGGPGGIDWLALALSGNARLPCARAALAALLVQLSASLLLFSSFLYLSRSLNFCSFL